MKTEFGRFLLLIAMLLLTVAGILFFAAGVKADYSVSLPYVRNQAVAGQCTFTDIGSVAYLDHIKMQVVVAGLQTLIVYPCNYDGRYGDITLEIWARKYNSYEWEWERITFFGVIPECDPNQFIQRAISNGLRCNTWDPMVLAFDENGYLVDSAVFY